MSDSSASSYIHKVQHLIEECMLFKMSKEECMEALSKHANIVPVITSTVWKELEKENKEFFEAYHTRRGEEKQQKVTEMGMLRQRMEKMLLDFNTKTDISNGEAKHYETKGVALNGYGCCVIVRSPMY